MQPFAAVALVLALLAGALLLLKRHVPRMQAQRRAGKLEVIERVSLGPHHALHLVRAGDRCVLIATAPSSCQLLDVAVSGDKF